MVARCWFWVTLLLQVSAGLMHGAPAAEPPLPLLLTDGTRSTARLIDLDDQQVVFQSPSGTSHFPWSRVVCWGWQPESETASQVVCADGSVLTADIQELSVNTVRAQTNRFGVVPIPRNKLAGIILRPSTEILGRDQLFQRLLTGRRETEQIWFFNGDELDGLAVSDPQVTPFTTVHIEPSQALSPVENIVAIAGRTAGFPARTDQQPTIWIGWRDGTRIQVSGVERRGAGVGLTLAGGTVLTMDQKTGLADACWVHTERTETATPKCLYLSDRQALGYKHIPWLSNSWELGTDQNVRKGCLRSNGHGYRKGLGMHSASRVSYELDRQFRWFDAELAIDDQAQGRGSVVFRVFLDRVPSGQNPHWELAYESPLVRGGQAPVPIRVDVANAQRLALVVDFAERGDECDYANWLLPRLTQ